MNIIFLDACLILKLVRNGFSSYGTLKDKTGAKINWQYIKELHKVQESEWLKLGNKLTRAHVSCEKSKVYCWYVAHMARKYISCLQCQTAMVSPKANSAATVDTESSNHIFVMTPTMSYGDRSGADHSLVNRYALFIVLAHYSSSLVEINVLHVLNVS